MSRPSENTFRLLIELKVAMVRDGKYTYSPEFEASVRSLLEHPLGRVEQTRMGYKVRSAILPALVKYVVHINKKREYVENVIVAYVCLVTHAKRLGIGLPEKQLADVVYGTFYLNDNEPAVEVVENV